MDHDAGHSLDDFASISHTAPPGEEGFNIMVSMKSLRMMQQALLRLPDGKV
jgi:hypothetical protein